MLIALEITCDFVEEIWMILRECDNLESDN